MISPEQLLQISVTKRWGREVTIYNHKYAMKKLVVEPNEQTSMHFHLEKDETMLVISGTGELIWKNELCHNQVVRLLPDVAVNIPPGAQHRIINTGSVPLVIIEASTHDLADDSIRTEFP